MGNGPQLPELVQSGAQIFKFDSDLSLMLQLHVAIITSDIKTGSDSGRGPWGLNVGPNVDWILIMLSV